MISRVFRPGSRLLSFWVQKHLNGAQHMQSQLPMLKNILLPSDVGRLWLRHGACFWIQKRILLAAGMYSWNRGWARVLSCLVEDGWTLVFNKESHRTQWK